MKKIAFLIGFCILFIGFVPILALAQEAAPPQNFVVFEEFVSPSDMPAFKKVQEQTVELWNKHKLDIPVWAYQNDDNAYYWVIPLENFGGLDALYAKMMEFSEMLKTEEGFDADQAFRDLTTGRQSVLHWSQDLSYHPTGNFGQSKDEPFVEWTFCYMKAGHEKEAGKAIKKYQEFYDGIDETYDWDVYMVMLGHDTPCWILMTRGESELAIRKLENELGEKYGKQFQEMWSGFAKHVRKFENKKGWFLPKWSLNLPE